MAVELAPDHLARARKLLRVLASHTLHSKDLPEAMARVIAKEWHPGAHMLHVTRGVLGIGLVSKMPMRELGEMALGAMLHDVGKGPEQFQQEPEGPESPQDEGVARQHPARGAEKIRKLCPNSDGITAMAAEHHERLDGKGFPRGIAGKDIHPWAKICAVVDAFDNLVTPGPGVEVISPADALERIESEVGHRFDAEAYTFFKRQLGPASSEPIGNQQPLPAARLEPGAAAPDGRDRREHARHPFQVAFVVHRPEAARRGGKKQLVVQGLDISRGGIHFLSRAPLCVGEEIVIHLPNQKGGRVGAVRARVVRAKRSALADGYDVGAQFLEV
jgi:hypothetical protein